MVLFRYICQMGQRWLVRLPNFVRTYMARWRFVRKPDWSESVTHTYHCGMMDLLIHGWSTFEFVPENI